jgi:hypothetical protein
VGAGSIVPPCTYDIQSKLLLGIADEVKNWRDPKSGRNSNSHAINNIPNRPQLSRDSSVSSLSSLNSASNQENDCTIVSTVKEIEVDCLPLDCFDPKWEEKWGRNFLYAVLSNIKETFFRNPEVNKLCCYYDKHRDKNHAIVCNDNIVENMLLKLLSSN